MLQSPPKYHHHYAQERTKLQVASLQQLCQGLVQNSLDTIPAIGQLHLCLTAGALDGLLLLSALLLALCMLEGLAVALVGDAAQAQHHGPGSRLILLQEHLQDGPLALVELALIPAP